MALFGQKLAEYILRSNEYNFVSCHRALTALIH